MELLEMTTYHGIAIGFIALSLRVQKKDESAKGQLTAPKSGALIVSTYLVQGIAGLAITLLLFYLFKSSETNVYAASGILLPMGYGQGPGQANNIGTTFETLGLNGGRSFGLAIATVFAQLLCMLFAIFHVKKRGFPFDFRLKSYRLVKKDAGALLRTGALEGEIAVPQYVIHEIQTLADSSDDATREKGKRALDLLQQLREENLITVDDTDDGIVQDVDVKLMRAARDCGGTVITTDTTMQKAAAISSIRTLNLHELAEALRPDRFLIMPANIPLTRAGKEPGQGVGHLPDGTMVVVENAKDRIGEEVEVTVTAVRQTSGGRMAFARANEQNAL